MKTTSRFIAILLFVVSISARAQVGINSTGANPDNSAMLDVSAANKGLLLPRIALTGTNDATTVISPAVSLLVYNTATVSDVTPGFYYYNGVAWKRLVSGTETDPVFTGAIDVSGSLAGDFLKYDGTKFVKFTPNFTESNYLYNTRYGVKLLARNNAQPDVDFVLSPKGGGAMITQQPDGTVAGGNIRGLSAVDLQMVRTSATKVASGDYSITIGADNTASNTFSTAIGCSNTASGQSSFAAGYHNTAQSYGESVLGFYATVGSGNYSDFVSTDRLFVIGNGDPISTIRSDALSILKNANTTIGGSLTLNGNGTGTSLTLPANRGTNGYVLTTNGNGGTSWTAPAVGTVTGVTGTAPIVSSGGAAPDISISAATTSAAGSMSAADKTKLDAITGTNTGNQTITLTGDVTGSGTGTFAATIAGGAVTNAKMATMTANTMKVNNTAAAAAPTDLALAANTFPSRKSTGNIMAYPITDFAFDMLNDANAAAVRTTIGAGTGNGTVTGVTGTAPIVSSGGTTPAISISAATTSAAGSMSAADKTKLDGIATNANNYTHPTGDGNLHVPATSTTNNGKVLTAGSTAGSLSWTSLPSAPVTSVAGKTGTVTLVSSDVGLGNVENTAISTWTGSANITTLGTITTGTWSGTSIGITKGGTGAITKTAGFDALSPMTTQGDIIYGGTSGTGTRLAKGTAGQVLKMNEGATAPQWSAPNIGTVTSVSGTAPVSVSAGNTTPVISVADATTDVSGLMSAADKNKLNNIVTHYIGENYGGGTVFYVTDNGQHGLIASTTDISNGIRWFNGTFRCTGTTGDGLYAGKMNTAIIVAAQMADNQSGNFAAKVCADYSVIINGVTYGDWYLPSKYELNLLFQQKSVVGGFADETSYWCSTEYATAYSDIKAWRLYCPWGFYDFGKDNTYRVRAIRSF